MKSAGIETTPNILNRKTTHEFVKRRWKDQTLYHRLVFLFKGESATLLEKMKHCAQNRDMGDMHDHAHKLMGNCAVVGAERAWTLVAAACRKSSSGNLINGEAILEIDKEVNIFLHEADLYLEEFSLPKTAK